MTAAAFRKRCLAEHYRLEAELADEEADRLEARERERAIMAALRLYEGAPSARAVALARDFESYLGRAWSRERGLAVSPPSASAIRRALHRLARSRDGEPIGWRRIYDIAQNCSPETLMLQKALCESRDEDKPGAKPNGRARFSES